MKNRYDGQLGKFMINFNRDTLCFKSTDFNIGREEEGETMTIREDTFDEIEKSFSKYGH